MDYIYMIISSIVVISCFYFIIAPFFSNEKWKTDMSETNEAELPVDMIYSAVNELEMDFLMKKISKEDFETMKAHYHSLAAGYLKTEQNKKIKEPKVKRVKNDEAEREILNELNKLRNSKTKKRNE